VKPPDQELTATPILYPFRGSYKRVQQILLESRVLVRSLAWAAVLWVSAAGVLLWLLSGDWPVPGPIVLLLIAAIAGVAERQSVRLFTNGGTSLDMSVAFLPFVFTAVAFGPLAAFIVGAAANLSDLRRPYLRWAVYTPIRAITGAAAGLAATAAGSSASLEFGVILVAASLAAVANLLCDALLNFATALVRGGTSPWIYTKAMIPLFFVALPLYVPAVALLVYGYEKYSIAAIAAFLVPVVALQRVIHLYQEQREAARRLSEVNASLERANLSFASALVATLDARDRYTAGHSAAVAIYSRDIAKRLGLDDEQQQRCYLTGLVHDIGKIGLAPGLLEKPGALTLEERRQMQEHSAIGERILSHVDTYPEVAQIVRHHHERVDGTGYPDGLRGDEIPLLSRIIAVADAYNAMTSDRPYRDAMPSRVARLRLAQAVESQFDTAVVAAFEAILAGSDETYRMAQRSDFQLIAAPAQVHERQAA
jgi:putative nucleotidyltransferase with HDIG domain